GSAPRMLLGPVWVLEQPILTGLERQRRLAATFRKFQRVYAVRRGEVLAIDAVPQTSRRFGQRGERVGKKLRALPGEPSAEAFTDVGFNAASRAVQLTPEPQVAEGRPTCFRQPIHF